MFGQFQEVYGRSKDKAILAAVMLFSWLKLDGKWQKAALDPFSNDTRAQSVGSGAQTAVNLVVGLVVGGLLAAFLLPIAIDEISAVDTSSWSNGAGALWDILPVMVVLAIFLFFTGLALRRM